MKIPSTLFIVSVFVLLSCKKDDAPTTSNGNQTDPPKLSSTMFTDKGPLPKVTGRYHGNISPDLKIENVPAGTVEIALTMRDIDASNSWHWAVWDIPATKTSLVKSEPWTGLGVTIGDNDYDVGYTGPFPPNQHEYVFTVYFLKSDISLNAASYNSLETAMQGNVISQVSFSGTYTP